MRGELSTRESLGDVGMPLPLPQGLCADFQVHRFLNELVPADVDGFSGVRPVGLVR